MCVASRKKSAAIGAWSVRRGVRRESHADAESFRLHPSKKRCAAADRSAPDGSGWGLVSLTLGARSEPPPHGASRARGRRGFFFHHVVFR
eukprot:2020406-Prymnesium_polylepis.1